MCYGHWMQCSFMNGPPSFGRRDQPESEKKAIHTRLDIYKVPAKCNRPNPRDEIALYAFEEKNTTEKRGAAAEETLIFDGVEYKPRKKMVMTDRGLILGSDTTLDGQILNLGKDVQGQHAALLHNSGKLFLKPINGTTHLKSISSFHADLLTDDQGRKPRRYVNTGGVKDVTLNGGTDPLKKLTREFCCFTMGDSKTVYWVNFPGLPLGDEEYEEGGFAPDGSKAHDKANGGGRADGGRADGGGQRGAVGDGRGAGYGANGRDHDGRGGDHRGGDHRGGDHRGGDRYGGAHRDHYGGGAHAHRERDYDDRRGGYGGDDRGRR